MTDDKPCDRTDLSEEPDMHCGCGFEAGEHSAWLRRIDRRMADRSALGIFQRRSATEWKTPGRVPDPTEASAAYIRKVLGVPDVTTETASRLRSAMPNAPQPRQSRCSGCYDSFSGPWCDNCDQWPCVREEGE